MDVDAYMEADSCIKEATIHVADKLSLPYDWLNDDFLKTDSYSPHLPLYSKYYKTFNHILVVRTITREYLIAMKLVSLRKYRRDRSDIVGIILEETDKNNPVTFEQVDKAVKDLYGNWDRISIEGQNFIKDVLKNKDLENAFSYIREEEGKDSDALREIIAENPHRMTREDVDKALIEVKKRREK